MRKYRVRVCIEGQQSAEQSETILGNVHADSIDDVVKLVEGFSLAKKETAEQQHNRLVELQNTAVADIPAKAMGMRAKEAADKLHKEAKNAIADPN